MRRRAQLIVGMLAITVTSALSGCTAPPERSGEGSAATPSSKSDSAKTPKREATIPADGWNEEIAWQGLEDGLVEAKKIGLPVMMVVHTSWCSRCKALKQEFNHNPSIEELSDRFVMVHVDQDEEPSAQAYGPDGTYIPRVMFLDSDGKLDEGLYNPNRSTKFRYFYTPQEDLVATMRQAIDRHGNKS